MSSTEGIIAGSDFRMKQACIDVYNKMAGNMKKNFIFIIRRPDGCEYENVVSASNEAEAKQRLKNILDIFGSRDEIVRLKETR